MYDKDFGEIIFDSNVDPDFLGKFHLRLFENDYSLELRIINSSDSGITEKQRQTFREFLQNEDRICNDIEKRMFEYYNSEVNEKSEDCEDGFAIQPAKTISEIGSNVTPIILGVENYSKDNIINILFNLSWDSEAGIGIRLRNTIIDCIGTQAEII